MANTADTHHCRQPKQTCRRPCHSCFLSRLPSGSTHRVNPSPMLRYCMPWDGESASMPLGRENTTTATACRYGGQCATPCPPPPPRRGDSTMQQGGQSKTALSHPGPTWAFRCLLVLPGSSCPLGWPMGGALTLDAICDLMGCLPSLLSSLAVLYLPPSSYSGTIHRARVRLGRPASDLIATVYYCLRLCAVWSRFGGHPTGAPRFGPV
ncbi:hypothetical protein GQ53DRAFT_406219 [Thozetella sp. PMI_491]|nr:hypothetical protein GQ53DRAFT_406219 [Thozetella sp. PMI_491]